MLWSAVPIVVLLAAPPAGGAASTLDAIAARVPSAVGDLQATGKDVVYSRSTIYDYIDGGAELYLAYGMKACLARQYRGAQGSVTLDLFEMATPADAFGIFAHDQDGQAIAIGQNGCIRPGWLSFWQGRWFASITAERDDAATQDAMAALGKVVAGTIGETGEKPAIVSWLPAAGLRDGSIRYLHDPVVLAAEVSVPAGNPLHIGAGTEVTLARYERAGQRAVLVVASYPGSEPRSGREQPAEAALRGFLERPRGQGVQVAADGSWRAGEVLPGGRLVLVLEATGREIALALVNEAATVIQGGSRKMGRER